MSPPSPPPQKKERGFRMLTFRRSRSTVYVAPPVSEQLPYSGNPTVLKLSGFSLGQASDVHAYNENVIPTRRIKLISNEPSIPHITPTESRKKHCLYKAAK